MNKYIIYDLEQLEKITGYSLQHIKNDINDVYNKLEEKDKEIERLNNIINKLEEQLNKGISIGICAFNKRSAKSLLSGAKYYQLFILDYLKELKEGK